GRLQSTSEMAVRATSLREIGGYLPMPLALGSDDLTWLTLSVNHPIVSTNHTYARWRRHSQSISGAVWSEKKQRPYLNELYRRIILFLSEHKPLAISSELLDRVIHERYQKTLPPPPKIEPKPELVVSAKRAKVALLPPIAAKLLRTIRKSVKSPSANREDAGNRLLFLRETWSWMGSVSGFDPFMSAGENQYGGVFSSAAPEIRSRLVVCFHQPPSWWRLHWRDVSLLNGLKAIVCLCQEQQDYFTALSSTPVIILRHGVLHDFFTPEFDRLPGSPRLLFVGHWLRDLDVLEMAM